MPTKNKILDIKKLKSIRSKYSKKKIVLCHGVFDLLHVGHIDYFKTSKKHGDILVVSITSDQFVNKGPGRPAFSISNRIKFLKEISCIDYLYVSNDETSEKIIRNLKPNFYCKGSDYSKKHIKYDKNLRKETYALKKVGGKFIIINEISFSSSEFINENNLQNFNEDCKKYLNLIKKKFSLEKILKDLNSIKEK